MLTDPKCKNAKCEGKAILKLADCGGLSLWVYEDGRKYWRLRYWIAGKEMSLSLGVYPHVGLKEARRGRDEERKHLAAKLDPFAERKADKLQLKVAHENSFEAGAQEWYFKQVKTWVPSHALDVRHRLEMNAYPHIGRRPAS